MKKIKTQYLLWKVLISTSIFFLIIGSVFFIGYKFIENETASLAIRWLCFILLSTGLAILFFSLLKYPKIIALNKFYLSKNAKSHHSKALINERWRYQVQNWDKELESFNWDLRAWLDHLITNKMI